MSHPVRVRGLKLNVITGAMSRCTVAPRAGAWIETRLPEKLRNAEDSRTPCGCVD